MHYRREIDGLRAVAVVPVILFHAGVNSFSGGFVGVDVFFVISGYLITALIVKDLEAGTFSFLDFYERRARRILPALFLVIVFCSPFAWMWMLPIELRAFSNSVVAVCLFASNFLFWQQSGYFDVATELKPLLHTWSLAVEEQYYIIFPIALLLLLRLGRRGLIWSLGVIAVLSILLSEYASGHYTSANFYSLPTRSWELLAGALCSFAVIRPNTLRDNIFSIVGLAAIVSSVFLFDETIPFPSVYTLLPVLGACAVLLFARQGTLVGSLLSLKPIVGIGLISYSAYLWHQPLFAFARIRSLTEPTWELMLPLAAASILLAYFSWRFVELPARQRGTFLSKSGRTPFVTFGVAGLVLIAASMGVSLNTSVVGPSENKLGKVSLSLSGLDGKCLRDYTDISSIPCVLGSKDSKVIVVALGDSHIWQWADELNKMGKRRDWKIEIYAKSACALPFVDYIYPKISRKYTECTIWRNDFFRKISSNPPYKL